MAGENANKRAFHEDMFAEDNEKWSWSLGVGNSKAAVGGSNNYTTVLSGDKDDSSDSSNSEDELGFRADSASLKKSFRKRQSSSASEGNPQEDISSSSGTSGLLPHERVLPSVYDDNARSGSPVGTYTKSDLAFMSSFRTDVNPLGIKGCEQGLFHTLSSDKADKSQNSDKGLDFMKNTSNKEVSPTGSPKDFKHVPVKQDSRRSSTQRSHSGDRKSIRSKSRSRSRSRDARSKNNHSSSHSKDRSRSRDRKQIADRKRSRSRDSKRRSRSRSRDSRRRSRSRDLKRSRSKDSRRRSRSKESKRRSRSRDSKRRSRSREYKRRSRSRSRGHGIRRRSRSRSLERHRRGRRSSSRDRYRRRRYSRSRSRSRGRSGSSHRKPGSLPLSTSGGAMTPQMALQQTMAAMSAKAQALTGIALPKYYNPAAVNPLKYAEQVQKRKLLWQSKDKEEEQPKNTVWDKLTFAQDQDGKMTAKFRKLMGIKTESEAAEKEPVADKESVLKKQEELFRDLDQQYEMARMTTHTQRGVGLGYSAQAIYPPVQK